MEITTMTFVTLTILSILAVCGLVALFKALDKHDGMNSSTLNKPLKNKTKPWYH